MPEDTTGAEEREKDTPVNDLQTLPCPTCAQETDFEQPGCVDGHTEDGGACPEWACTDCGTALVIGHVPGPRAEVRQHAA